MYQENQALRKDRDEILCNSKIKVQEAEEAKNRSLVRLKEFEALVQTNVNDSDYIHKSLIEAQRNLVVLKVNEEILTRRYVVAQESEERMSKEIHRLNSDLINLDKVARSTILRLKKSKNEALSRTEKLEKELLESIPKTDYLRQEHKLKLFISKCKILMEREKAWIEFKNRREIDLFKEQEASKKLNQVEMELFEQKSLVIFYLFRLIKRND